MITSLSNEKIKLTRALARRRTRHQERRFILEGVRLLDELVRSNVHPDFVLHTRAVIENPEAAALLQAFNTRRVPCYPVADQVMEACADTVTPSGLLAVAPFPHLPPPAHPTWTLVVDNMRTPGNLGTLLRTAAAAGTAQVLLSPGTVDLYHPQVVRGGAGAHFRIPILQCSWQEIGERLKDTNVWLATAHSNQPYTQVDWTQPLGLVIGSEAHGATPEALALSTGRVSIPMAHAVESLNAAMAAGILLFEIARQRRAFERTPCENSSHHTVCGR
jgi:RNA methyltransferase, TrmH family